MVSKYFASAESFAILSRLGLVAQLVEQRIENPCVGGSIPPRATKRHIKKAPAFLLGLFAFVRSHALGLIKGRYLIKLRSIDPQLKA